MATDTVDGGFHVWGVPNLVEVTLESMEELQSMLSSSECRHCR